MPFYLSAIALSLLYTLTRAHPLSIWHVSIDEGPAPPPDEGPPLSAHALRDRSKLVYEIIGIGGAYVFWLLISGILILLVRRRLQRRKHLLYRSFSMEVAKPQMEVKPTPMTADRGPISPKSPGRFTAWISPGRGHSHQASHASMSTVDERIVEADRAKNIDDMAKLYAVVMQQDEEKAQKARVQTYDEPPLRSPLRSPTQQPPEFQHLKQDTSALQPSNQSIATTAVDDDDIRTAVASRASSRKTKASPLSFLSDRYSRTDSANSNRSRPSRISFRGQPISHPVGSPGLADSSVYSSDDPSLSPRVYTPGPPPPTPGQKSAAAQAREAALSPRFQPPAALSLRSTAATNSTSSLPFRQVYPESMKSAPATKTTFLEKRENIHPAAMTGAASIPYSPYMPYTPVTPITPHLVTREEMKRNKKKYGGGGPLSPDDVVPSEEEMWGKVI